ncbi:uncharacterized protein TNIN_466991 [Trichonephila inaurata madagascariensis]|uniref:Uncharacterized protein n=1 Tax=Trichonephila inaurata madagascariensis TaxID=2747483 RepID=A0A8X7CRT0_9ARAC|nr:uncharacterized protein TNIN_466991 [Trichonephila inaurata madagascariensis]
MGKCSYCPRKRTFHGNQNACIETASCKEEIMTTSSLKLQQCNQNRIFQFVDQLAQVLQEENCPVQALHEIGVRVLLVIYNAPNSENSLDNLRCTQFIKSTKLNKPVQLSNIPPTSAAAHQHIS